MFCSPGRKTSDPQVIEPVPGLRVSDRISLPLDPTYQLDLEYESSLLTSRFLTLSHLHQVPGNLVGNGLRYSQKATGEGWVKPACVIDATGQVQPSVMDRGPGISKQDQEHLFDSFYHRKQGTGLGLYICKELQRSQSGNVGVYLGRGRRRPFSYYLAHPKNWHERPI